VAAEKTKKRLGEWRGLRLARSLMLSSVVLLVAVAV
jgi:hypothetical protein